MKKNMKYVRKLVNHYLSRLVAAVAINCSNLQKKKIKGQKDLASQLKKLCN